MALPKRILMPYIYIYYLNRFMWLPSEQDCLTLGVRTVICTIIQVYMDVNFVSVILPYYNICTNNSSLHTTMLFQQEYVQIFTTLKSVRLKLYVSFRIQ